ncbi:Protein involved in meta-pathway of phenol degradation OS=Afipia felis OX=1035 GN=BN961_01748 PE=4 SV=1 [Afipia felis]
MIAAEARKATKLSVRCRAGSLLSAAVSIATLTGVPAHAAENGVSFYLLGSKSVSSGILPPPGIYLQNDVYYNEGSLSASRDLPLNGKITAGLRVKTWVEMPTLIWSTPLQVLGGNVVFMGIFPIGGPSVDVGAVLTGPKGGVIGQNVHDSIFTIGDPVFGSSIGWHAGDFHWNVGMLVNAPIGDYRNGALANLSFNHWAEDFNASFTWLDSKTGLEISNSFGVIFNQINDATQYRTGTQFHYEGGVIWHMPNNFAFGVVGYYLDQLSADSGPGAVLGPFKSRAAAIGGYAGYTFKAGELPVTTSIKVFQEFNVRNRLENGVAGFFTIGIPLSVASSAPAASIPRR